MLLRAGAAMPTETPTAEPQAAEATPEPKSVGPLTELQDTLSSAWGVPASNGTEAPPEPPAREDSPVGSVAPEAALKPGDAPRSTETQADEELKTEGEPPKLSRRQAEEQERQAEIRRVLDQVEAERTEKETALKTAAAAQAQVRAYETEALTALGDDAEFTRLMTIRMDGRRNGEYLSVEDDDRLDTMLQTRRLAKAFRDMSERQVRAEQYQTLRPAAEKLGIDKALLDQQPAIPQLIEHAITATEARVRGEFEPKLAERDEQIADLEAENEGLRARAVGRSRAPQSAGGSSAVTAAGPGNYDDSRSPLDNLRDVLSVKIPGG